MTNQVSVAFIVVIHTLVGGAMSRTLNKSHKPIKCIYWKGYKMVYKAKQVLVYR